MVLTGEKCVESENKDEKRKKKKIKGREGNDKQGCERETRCLYPKVQERTNEEKLQDSSTCLPDPNVGMMRLLLVCSFILTWNKVEERH